MTKEECEIESSKAIMEMRKHIAELEAEVKEWKDKANLWSKTANLKDTNIRINKELEKENALKKIAETVPDSYKDGKYLPESRLDIIGDICEEVLKE